MFRFFFLRAVELDPTRDRVIPGLVLRYFIRLALPIIAIALVSGVFSNVVQSGLLFTTKPLSPKLSRILPHFGRYFKKTLFSVESLFNFFKSIIKMAIIGGVAFFIIRSRIEQLANLQTANLWVGITTVASLAIRLLIMSALLMLFLAVPDYLFQRWQYRESLKMTKQEMKEDIKQSEGDPLIKARLKSRMREILSRNMAINVPKADVVIRNPTHYAIALEYNQDQQAPRVTAKGEDEMALRIIRIAQENDVPLVENRPLAQALYKTTELGDFIPEIYFEAVAQILSKVWSMNEERRRRRAQSA
jgi:flagellar biosynthetic protein FlhB